MILVPRQMDSILEELTKFHSCLAYRTDVSLISIHSDFLKMQFYFTTILFYIL